MVVPPGRRGRVIQHANSRRYAAFQFNEAWSNCISFTLVTEAAQKQKDHPPPTQPPAPVVFSEIGVSIGKVFVSFMPVADATSYQVHIWQSDCADTSQELGAPVFLAWTAGHVAAETLTLAPVLVDNGWVFPADSVQVLTSIDAVPQTAYRIHIQACNDGGCSPEGILLFLAGCS